MTSVMSYTQYHSFNWKRPKKGVGWPFLALITGTSSQGIPKQFKFSMPERVYQVSRPGRAKIPLSWAFADKRIFPNFAFFEPKVNQIWHFPKF